MSWTLWRGADLLGTVYPRSVPDAVQERDDRRDVNAILVPDPRYLPLQSLRQTVHEWPGGEMVREHLREPHVWNARPRGDRSSKPAIGIWLASHESPPPSVPLGRQLRIRDRDGRTLPTFSIGLLEFRPDPAHPPTELATLPEGAFVGGSIWLVSFTQHLTTPAT